MTKCIFFILYYGIRDTILLQEILVFFKSLSCWLICFKIVKMFFLPEISGCQHQTSYLFFIVLMSSCYFFPCHIQFSDYWQLLIPILFLLPSFSFMNSASLSFLLVSWFNSSPFFGISFFFFLPSSNQDIFIYPYKSNRVLRWPLTVYAREV